MGLPIQRRYDCDRSELARASLKYTNSVRPTNAMAMAMQSARLLERKKMIAASPAISHAAMTESAASLRKQLSHPEIMRPDHSIGLPIASS